MLHDLRVAIQLQGYKKERRSRSKKEPQPSQMPTLLAERVPPKDAPGPTE